MKQRIIFRMAVALLVICALLLASIVVSQVRVQRQLPFQIRRTFALPQARAQQTIYKLVPQFRTIDDARSRARLLGLQPASLQNMQQVEDEFKVSDGKWDYSLDPEQQLEVLLDHEVMTDQTGHSALVPDLEQCRSLALQFLGTENLILGTKGEELRYESTNEMMSALFFTEDQGQPLSEPRVLMREIVFGKVIDGVPVVGPGSRVSVFIGDRGNVVGYMSDWMPAAATTETVQVAKLDAAYTLLEGRLGLMNSRLPDPSLQAREIDVKGSRYALRAFKNKEGELVLLPVYQFRGMVKDQQNRSLKFQYRVMAVTNRAAVTRDLGITEPAPVQQPPVQVLKMLPAKLKLPVKRVPTP